MNGRVVNVPTQHGVHSKLLRVTNDRFFELADEIDRILDARQALVTPEHHHHIEQAGRGGASGQSRAQGLRDLQGISVATIDIVLNAIDAAVRKLKETYPDNPLIDLSRASATPP